MKIILSILCLTLVFACSQQITETEPNNSKGKGIAHKSTMVQNSNAGKLNKTFEVENQFLNSFARAFSVKLAEVVCSDYLSKEIMHSENFEHILYLADLLESPDFTRKFLDAEFLSTINCSGIADLKQRLNLFPSGIDIYFPQVHHGNKYKAGDELYIGYVPVVIDDMDIEEITAYILTGKNIKLTTEYPPEIPTLIIAACEHYGKHSTNAMISDPGGGGGGGSSSGYDADSRKYGDFEYLYEANLRNDHEPWIKGAPEIYLQATNPSYDQKPFAAYQGFSTRINLYNKWESWGENQGWKGMDILVLEWHSMYGSVLLYKWMESDGGDMKSGKIQYNGYKFAYSYADDDDDCGHQTVNLLDSKRDRDTRYDTGDVWWTDRWKTNP